METPSAVHGKEYHVLLPTSKSENVEEIQNHGIEYLFKRLGGVFEKPQGLATKKRNRFRGSVESDPKTGMGPMYELFISELCKWKTNKEAVRNRFHVWKYWSMKNSSLIT